MLNQPQLTSSLNSTSLEAAIVSAPALTTVLLSIFGATIPRPRRRCSRGLEVEPANQWTTLSSAYTENGVFEAPANDILPTTASHPDATFSPKPIGDFSHWNNSRQYFPDLLVLRYTGT